MAPYLLGTSRKNVKCYVCRPLDQRHRHANSKFYRERCGKLGIPAPCTTCLDPDHPPLDDGRIKLVSTSSTLHHVQYCETFEAEMMKTVEELGAAFHVDFDMISGGRLDDLMWSWKKSYWDQPLAQDIAVVAGLNDVGRMSVDDYMEKLEEWRALVMEHSAKWSNGALGKTRSLGAKYLRRVASSESPSLLLARR